MLQGCHHLGLALVGLCRADRSNCLDNVAIKEGGLTGRDPELDALKHGSIISLLAFCLTKAQSSLSSSMRVCVQTNPHVCTLNRDFSSQLGWEDNGVGTTLPALSNVSRVVTRVATMRKPDEKQWARLNLGVNDTGWQTKAGNEPITFGLLSHLQCPL